MRLKVYEEKFARREGDECWRLNVRRLEDAWFLFELVDFFSKHRLLNAIDFNPNSLPGNRRDIEVICQKAIMHLSKTTPRWVHHSCDTKGCREGMVTIDGNEKIRRSMCAAPKQFVAIPHNGINVRQCCPRSPITGGKHQTASKYCEHYQHLTTGHDDSCSTSLMVHITLPIPGLVTSLTPKATGELPDADSNDLLVSCKKSSNVDKFFDTTAGIAAIVRPCGIVVNVTEMYTCESPTQMYIFLLLTFGRGKDIERLKYLAYDRACDLHPFLLNLQKKDVPLAKYLLRSVKFLVDSWHVKKHTEPCCQSPTSERPALSPTSPGFRSHQRS